MYLDRKFPDHVFQIASQYAKKVTAEYEDKLSAQSQQIEELKARIT